MYSAAVTTRGELYTWGRGNYGRLGHGSSEDVSLPTLVVGLKGRLKKNYSSSHRFILDLKLTVSQLCFISFFYKISNFKSFVYVLTVPQKMILLVLKL